MSSLAPAMPVESVCGAPTEPARSRITSIDALRGFVMFTMIFVNSLAGMGKVVPDWMSHFSDRHASGSGMTFVDLVFPAFVFIVGMSIPFALGSRLNKGEPLWKIVLHVVTRTFALLVIGILMVNTESIAPAGPGWSPDRWTMEMFIAAIFSCCSISVRGANPSTRKLLNAITVVLRVAGWAALAHLTFTFRGADDVRIVKLSPFSINVEWFGILGIIAWAYLIVSGVFLIFRTSQTALLGCVALFLCFYPADRTGTFNHLWIAQYVSFSDTFGSHGAIAVAGLLLASILIPSDKGRQPSPGRFTLLFAAGFAAAALLVNGLYGISKNDATPSWCLWSCAITAMLWLGFHYFCKWAGSVSKPLVVAGQNVPLAYLLSEMLPNYLDIGGFGEATLAGAVTCCAAWSILLLLITAGLNRIGFRLKL